MNDLGRHKLTSIRLGITGIEVGFNLGEGATGWITHESTISADERDGDDLASRLGWMMAENAPLICRLVHLLLDRDVTLVR